MSVTNFMKFFDQRGGKSDVVENYAELGWDGKNLVEEILSCVLWRSYVYLSY